MPIEEGKIAPDFTLPNQDGTPTTLSDFRGKQVVIYFYPRDNTPGCTKESCGFRDNWSTLEANGVVVLGISPDGAASHQKFISKFDLPFTLLSDTDKTMMTEWGAFGEKMMYGKKVMGVIRSTVWLDDNGTVKKHWKRVARAADHPAKVMEALGLTANE